MPLTWMLTGYVRFYQIECYIDEWSTGRYKESTWKEEHYKTIYLSHINSLLDLKRYGANLEGKNLLAQIQDDLLKNARSVSSLSIINSPR